MTDLLVKAIKETIHFELSDEEIERLIDENRAKIAIILYESWKKDQISTREESSCQLSWARRSKLDLDDCKFSDDETTLRELSVYETCHEKYTEGRDDIRADKFTDIIAGFKDSMIQREKYRRYAIRELRTTIAKEDDFERRSTETNRNMEEDLSNGIQ